MHQETNNGGAEVGEQSPPAREYVTKADTNIFQYENEQAKK